MEPLNSDFDKGRAIVNGAAFRFIMSVVEDAVYGQPLTSDSPSIKSLYEFLESDRCKIDFFMQ